MDQLFARDTTNIDWEFIHGLFANAIYGGRVDDVHDIRILTSYLKDMFQPEVIATGKRSLGPLSLPGGSAGKFFQFTGFLFDNKLCKNVIVLCWSWLNFELILAGFLLPIFVLKHQRQNKGKKKP